MFCNFSNCCCFILSSSNLSCSFLRFTVSHTSDSTVSCLASRNGSIVSRKSTSTTTSRSSLYFSSSSSRRVLWKRLFGRSEPSTETTDQGIRFHHALDRTVSSPGQSQWTNLAAQQGPSFDYCFAIQSTRSVHYLWSHDTSKLQQEGTLLEQVDNVGARDDSKGNK